MRKRSIILLVLIGILALTGCQKDLTKNNGNQPVTETQKENTEKSTESETEAVGFSYGELSDYQFNLSSGAGAWHTELFINRDGSFYGTYSVLF